MYTLSLTGIITSYIIIALLLVSIVFYSAWTIKIKAASCIITAVFLVVSFMSFSPLLGWATEDEPPLRFRLISAYVEQPDKLSGDEGSIYIWITKLEDLTSIQVPRSHKLPYTEALHEKIINANAKLDKGIAQLGEFKKQPNFAMIGKDDTKAGLISDQIQFYDLPDPLFPDK